MTAFMNLYRIAFDENHQPRECGKEVISQLIESADLIEPNVRHGNATAGLMNVYLIKALYEKCS